MLRPKDFGSRIVRPNTFAEYSAETEYSVVYYMYIHIFNPSDISHTLGWNSNHCSALTPTLTMAPSQSSHWSHQKSSLVPSKSSSIEGTRYNSKIGTLAHQSISRHPRQNKPGSSCRLLCRWSSHGRNC